MSSSVGARLPGAFMLFRFVFSRLIFAPFIFAPFVFSSFIFSLAIFLFSFVGCAKDERLTVKFINGDGSQSPEISAELARNDPERSLGLMYRKNLPENSGMLFVFPDEQPRSFWMKNTYVPLDIIYMNQGLSVVSIQERAEPLTESARPSGKSAQYVLEINGGLAAKWGVKPGSLMVVSGVIPPSK